MSDHTISKNPIQKLPVSLSNQIAAGEVVERPASILKELIENSIDAGARHIRIEIQQAGLEKISVTDDGFGIPASELCLAVSPHATSKIYSQEQLGHINTLGFRGEALASIASVSKFEISSRVAEDDTAWKLDYSNKNKSRYDDFDISKLKLIPVAHPIGTTVIANKIFYNIPARKKYLRTERTEYLHVEKVIKQLLLSDFNSAFVFIHNDREVYRFQPALDEQAKSRRVQKICGKSFYENTITLNFQASGMTLKGWLAKENYSRSSADIQYFYINGRIIRDRVIFHAIRQVFKDKLPEGRYVAYILYLTINTEFIDVNVHPTKHEVRFSDLRLVHDFLSHVLTQALRSNDGSESNLNPLSEFDTNKQNSLTGYVSEASKNYSNNSIVSLNIPAGPQNFPESFFGNILGIIEQYYLLTEKKTGVTLINIKKAQSFLMTYKLLQQYKDNNIISKPLIIPASISLEQKQVDILEKYLNLFNKVGIEVTVTGLESIMLRSIPVVLTNINYSKLFKNIVVFLVNNKKIEIEAFLLVLCNSDLVDTINFNTELATQLLFKLNNLDDTILMSENNKWWHKMSADDLDGLFKN